MRAKPRIAWLVPTAFVICCLSIFLATTTYYVKETSSPETINRFKDFLDDFKPRNIKDMPLHPKGMTDDIKFLWELTTNG